jgi:hypothetical protein
VPDEEARSETLSETLSCSKGGGDALATPPMGDSRDRCRSWGELGASGIFNRDRTFDEISCAGRLLGAQVTIGKKP